MTAVSVPGLTAAQATADALRTFAILARDFDLPLPSRLDYWISQDRTEDEARAEISAAGTALAAAGITFELVADEFRLGLVLHLDGILAYHLTYLRPAARPRHKLPETTP